MTPGERKDGTEPLSRSRLQPPAVGFGCNPLDPSTFDSIHFFDYSYDPGQQGIVSRVWEFGDGSGASGESAVHRFAADGDYTVTLTVRSPDGRSNRASSTLCVRTHDIAISHFDVPPVCRAGEAVDVVVGVVSMRYDESVEVRLLRRPAREQGRFEQVGRVVTAVRGDDADGPTLVTLPIVFPADLAAEGSYSLQAVAAILGARDARHDDNVALAPIRIVA